MIKDVVIIGSNGFSKDVLALLEDNNEAAPQWNILGFIDMPSKEEPVSGYGIIGDDEWLMNYPHPISAVCGLGQPALRRKVLAKYHRAGNVSFPSVISSHALGVKHACFGAGCVVCAGSILAPNVQLSDFVSINLACTIGHDTRIGEYVMINPGSNISGNVHIGCDCEIGTGAKIIQGLRIGDQSIIGAGSVIIRDVPGHCTVVGNPGRILEK